VLCRFGVYKDEQKSAAPNHFIFVGLGRITKRTVVAPAWGRGWIERGNLWTGIHRKSPVVHRRGRSQHEKFRR